MLDITFIIAHVALYQANRNVNWGLEAKFECFYAYEKYKNQKDDDENNPLLQ